MNRIRRILVELDELLGQMFFAGIHKDETISRYVYRKEYWLRVAAIDLLFGKEHCRREFEDEYRN